MHEKAVEQFKMAVEIEPDNYQPIFFLTEVYKDLGLTNEMLEANQQALRVFRKHIGLNPDDTRALSLGAASLIFAGKIEEGLRWEKMAIALNPNDATILYNAACTYSLLGKVDEAIDYFARSIESGRTAIDWTENDSDIDNIREDPRFQELLKSMQ